MDLEELRKVFPKRKFRWELHLGSWDMYVLVLRNSSSSCVRHTVVKRHAEPQPLWHHVSHVYGTYAAVFERTANTVAACTAAVHMLNCLMQCLQSREDARYCKQQARHA
jgi:hypothetical protein